LQAQLAALEARKKSIEQAKTQTAERQKVVEKIRKAVEGINNANLKNLDKRSLTSADTFGALAKAISNELNGLANKKTQPEQEQATKALKESFQRSEAAKNRLGLALDKIRKYRQIGPDTGR